MKQLKHLMLRNLGVVIDEQPSFKPHILQLKKKIAGSLGIIAKLHYYLPKKTLLTKGIGRKFSRGGGNEKNSTI